ncbi:MAG: sugar ABC transporter ATP-binding protein [Actinobacteria bacterium]|nr:sugar ABC transporter ATP-binding protein [Actinomycetota bacterium]
MVLSARKMSKQFGPRKVLRDVDLDLRGGEVHGLLGQNGSGKSTLVKILAGYHAPEPGAELEIGGQAVDLPLSAGDAVEHGLAVVHQDLALAPSLSILENLRIGRYQTKAGWRIPWRDEARRARAALSSFGLDVSPYKSVEDLREVERAIVAIVRALEQLEGVDEGALILDEPTAYLPRDGVEHLFAAIHEVTGRGFGVLLVTHRLEEVTALADRVTVLRNGARVATAEVSGLDEDGLVELIVGRALEELFPPAHHPESEVVLEVEDLQGSDLTAPFSLQVRRSEIVGLTGLVGTGYERALYMMAGAERASAGKLRLGGATHDAARLDPRRALAAGLALLPANRLVNGGAGEATLTENVTLPTLPSFVSKTRLQKAKERRATHALLRDFSVEPPNPDLPLASLSGGNQQKALMAKWFSTGPQALLMHEPTQGVDVGARRQLFRRIRDLAEEGTPVVMASAEYGELAQMCDRVFVFRDGRVVSVLSGNDLTEDRIVQQCLLDRGSAAA